jgi:hypothetical protein
MSIPQQQPQRIDRGRGEKANIYMHRVMSDEMKKTNATLDDSFIPEMIEDMNRYCALLPSQKGNSDDFMNIFVLRSRDLTTKKYDPFIIQLDILESASFPFVSGTPLSELLLKVKDSGNARAIQILDATKSNFENVIEGLDLKYQLNCINILSETVTVQNINLNGFIAHFRTKKENYGRFLFAFHTDSAENSFKAADQMLADKISDLEDKNNAALDALEAKGKAALAALEAKGKATLADIQGKVKEEFNDAVSDVKEVEKDIRDAIAALQEADDALREADEAFAAKDGDIVTLVNDLKDQVEEYIGVDGGEGAEGGTDVFGTDVLPDLVM